MHVNLVGYAPDAAHKAADLYHWMGDGGARDYSSFEGNTVYVYDVTNGAARTRGAGDASGSRAAATSAATT